MKKKIMFLGTGSDVGKSLITTAFCRVLKDRGYRVTPFKAQNMSNNSFVTIEGGEIGRAQSVQAEAAGLTPSVHMNPVLLKPNSDVGSQLVLQGKVYKNMTGKEYYAVKTDIKKTVMESYYKLEKEFDVVAMEGAGSCSEVNLRKYDIVNFEMAISAKAPVVLIADIEKGGVFAQIIGSLEVISQEERDLVKGFIINKFRGDPDLFTDGIKYIEERTGKPVLGLMPYFNDISVESEDGMSLNRKTGFVEIKQNKINIAVIRFPHISNFTDLDALEKEPEININWLSEAIDLSEYDALILPGSKSSINDLLWLHERGWTKYITKFAQGGIVVGLCGGFQMLGQEILDIHHIEGRVEKVRGVGLLDICTRIEGDKLVKHSLGIDKIFGAKVQGYEIHMGRTDLLDGVSSFIELENGEDGAVNREKNVIGTYLHGLFDSGEFRGKFIEWVAGKNEIPLDKSLKREDAWLEKEKNYDLLAKHFSDVVDVEQLIEIMGNNV